MDTEYIVNPTDIDNLKKQIDINDDDARILLIKNNGNLVECVLDSYNFKDNISFKQEKTKFQELRKIVDEKNKVFKLNKKVNSSEIKVI